MWIDYVLSHANHPGKPQRCYYWKTQGKIPNGLRIGWWRTLMDKTLLPIQLPSSQASICLEKFG